jgi:hypothetical protein
MNLGMYFKKNKKLIKYRTEDGWGKGLSLAL